VTFPEVNNYVCNQLRHGINCDERLKIFLFNYYDNPRSSCCVIQVPLEINVFHLGGREARDKSPVHFEASDDMMRIFFVDSSWHLKIIVSISRIAYRNRYS